jgi:hypothetical protein
MQVGFQNFLDWREQNHAFSAMAAYEEIPTVVAGGDIPQRTSVAPVTGDFFRVLGVEAVLGRTFVPEEQLVGGRPVAVLSHGLWQRAFGGAPNIIGRSIRMAGMSLTVIGIMPRGFNYPENFDLWLPATAFGDPGFNIRTGHNWRVIGRLKTGCVDRARPG